MARVASTGLEAMLTERDWKVLARWWPSIPWVRTWVVGLIVTVPLDGGHGTTDTNLPLFQEAGQSLEKEWAAIK